MKKVLKRVVKVEVPKQEAVEPSTSLNATSNDQDRVFEVRDLCWNPMKGLKFDCPHCIFYKKCQYYGKDDPLGTKRRRRVKEEEEKAIAETPAPISTPEPEAIAWTSKKQRKEKKVKEVPNKKPAKQEKKVTVVEDNFDELFG